MSAQHNGLPSLASGAGDKRHALKHRANDLYQTPPEAVAALLRAEDLPRVIWEPACGLGAIVRPLRAAGRQVYATDLVNYETPDQDAFGWDFLMEKQTPAGVEAIITNPPFKNATAFVAHALTLCPKVIMLLRLAFLESEGRSGILDGGSLARVHIFRDRLPFMHREGWSGPRSTSTMPFAWFVWNQGWGKPTELHRISWKREG
jgi:hypothetical protein